MHIQRIRALRKLNSLWTGPALTLALILAFLVVSAVLASTGHAAPYDPTATTAKACKFGIDMGDGLNRIIAGAIVGLLFLAVAIGAVFQKLHGGAGGGAGSAIMGALMGSLDAGGAVFLVGMFGTFAAIAITAAGLPACP